MKNMHSMGRQYGSQALSENEMADHPIDEFHQWFQLVLQESIPDPTAMVLATVDDKGMPDARVVLLKSFDHDGFVFFTHYNSPKGHQAEKKGVVALNFYWASLARQIRIKGNIVRISKEDSDYYFSSRPRDSQLVTFASKQSEVISSRQILEDHIHALSLTYEGKSIPCPTTWGGYRVIPFEFEFFQGRDNRLNDRIRYVLQQDHWKMERLSP